MKNPAISVIVPVYNVEPYLVRCLDSILAQTFTDFELLLIDDGSPDRCGEICDDYAQKDSRVRVFHQRNAGVSCARNKGLDSAKGQYVVFVDSDDYVLPDYLWNLYEDVSVHSGVGLVIHGAHCVNSRGEQLRNSLSLNICLPYQRFSEILTVHEFVFWGAPWGKIYNRAVLNVYRLRFDEGIHFAEDTLFMLRYLFFCDYIWIHPVMNYVYVYYTDSLSHGCLSPFVSEYKTFVTFKEIVQRIRQTWKTSEETGMIVALANIFQRALKTDYQPYYKVCRKERIKHVRMLTDAAGDFLRTGCRIFAYKIDWFGGLLLEWRLFACYDWFISLMFRFPVRNFKYRYSASKNG